MEHIIVPSALYEKQLIEWLENLKNVYIAERARHKTDFFIRVFDGRIDQINETIEHIKFTSNAAKKTNWAALNKPQQ